MWRSKAFGRVALAAALALTACGLDGADEGGSGGPDAGAGDCAPGDVPFQGRCLGPVPTDPAQVCDYVAALGVPSVDDDGDCYVSGCEVALPPSVAVALADCDDRRPDARPHAPELCNEVDDDCDGRVDETFDIGGPCDEGCGAGKTECALGDPTRTTCSTNAGQSAADPAAVEWCDGVDDDCDGQVDERCRVDLPPAADRAHPRLCGDELVFVEDAARLVALPSGGVGAPDAAPTPRPVAEGAGLSAPTCGPAGFAWLQLDPAGDEPACAEPADGPRRCRARLWTLAPGDAPRDRTDLAAVGPPVVLGDEVLWHAVDGGRLRLRAARLDGLGAVEEAGEGHSDPGVATGDRLVVRDWVGGEPLMLLRRRAPGVGEVRLSSPDDLRPGPPALGDGWAVWSLGAPATLWAVDLELDHAFQVVDLPGDQRSPQLDGARVVWLDTGTRPPTLRELDLRTGIGGEVARGDIAPGDFAVRDGVVVWTAREADGVHLYRHVLPPLP